MNQIAADDRTERVLIFLLGSLGDTLVAIPALRLIARRFPNAEKRVLTNFSVSDKAAPMSAILDGSGLVDGYFRFPPGSRNPVEMIKTIMRIRRWRPQVLIHLHEPRGLMNIYRDLAFFRASGVQRIIGLPDSRALQIPLVDSTTGRQEHRSEYLGRRLTALGDLRLSDRSSWNLSLSEAERTKARSALAPLAGCRGIIAMSIGTKVDVNDWGDENWLSFIKQLGTRLPGWGLAVLGAASEGERSQRLIGAWAGTSLNLCGALSVRESGAVIEAVKLFVGHDSGPMHLAATVGTSCVAIFSGRNRPGKWFPYGDNHTVFYNKTECYACDLSGCVAFKKICILSITPESVVEAVVRRLQAAPLSELP